MNLRTYIETREPKLSLAAFAETVGVNVSTVHRYAQHDQVPGPETMLRIVKATKGLVGPEDFYPECKRLLDRLRRAHVAPHPPTPAAGRQSGAA